MDFEIRKDRTKPQGRKKLTREREAYSRLMQQGVRMAEGRPELHAIVQRAKAIAQAFGVPVV